MQFLHTVHCVVSNNLHNRHWNWHLFCLFALALKKMLLVLSLVLVLKQQFIKFSFIKLINGRSQTNRDQKSNLFFQQHD